MGKIKLNSQHRNNSFLHNTNYSQHNKISFQHNTNSFQHNTNSFQHSHSKVNNILKVLYANVQSIRNKFVDIQAEIISNSYDMIGLTETWLDNDDFIAEYNIPNYVIFTKERTGKRGGGVILLIKKHLNPIEIKTNIVNNVDSLYIELKNNSGKKITFGLYYRPPSPNKRYR